MTNEQWQVVGRLESIADLANSVRLDLLGKFKKDSIFVDEQLPNDVFTEKDIINQLKDDFFKIEDQLEEAMLFLDGLVAEG